MLFALCLALSALASDHLDGTWVLDPASAKGMDPVLEEMGVDALTRSLAGSAKVEVTLDGCPSEVRITSRSTFHSVTGSVPTDGRSIPVEGSRLESGTMRGRWESDGAVLVMETDSHLRDGRVVHLVDTRSLSGPDSMLQILVVTVDGVPATGTRVFRRSTR